MVKRSGMEGWREPKRQIDQRAMGLGDLYNSATMRGRAIYKVGDYNGDEGKEEKNGEGAWDSGSGMGRGGVC